MILVFILLVSYLLYISENIKITIISIFIQLFTLDLMIFFLIKPSIIIATQGIIGIIITILITKPSKMIPGMVFISIISTLTGYVLRAYNDIQYITDDAKKEIKIKKQKKIILEI